MKIGTKERTDRAIAADINTTALMLDQLFDHLPETAFFLKDTAGRYFAVNQSLVDHCGLRFKRELIGRHDLPDGDGCDAEPVSERGMTRPEGWTKWRNLGG